MDYEKWEAYYRDILEDFGFDRTSDERAAQLLDDLLDGERVNSRELRELIEGKRVIVYGNAPDLEVDDVGTDGLVIAADEATSVLIEAGVMPSIITTDLDGNVEDQLSANQMGTVVVIHGHGDNVAAIREWAPRFEGPVVATTQSAPFGNLYNFGGFTDGDRAVFLADHFGAAEIVLKGFDFKRVNPKDAEGAVKKRKLAWARKLLKELGRGDLKGL